ncbi:MAG: hypothetical protein ACOX1X_02265 [Dethiobacteria bacterium]
MFLRKASGLSSRLTVAFPAELTSCSPAGSRRPCRLNHLQPTLCPQLFAARTIHSTVRTYPLVGNGGVVLTVEVN